MFQQNGQNGQDTIKIISETKRDSQRQRTELWLPRGRRGEGVSAGTGIWDQQRQTTICRMDTQGPIV